MEDKAYIVIDDNDQRQRMTQRIDDILNPEGYKIKSFFFNPMDRDFWDENKNLDLNKFINRILSDIKTYHINAIASDYQFSGTDVNGIDIISALRKKGLSCRAFLYSGNEAKVAQELFASGLSDELKIQRFTTILKCKIEKFLTRDTYYESIVETLRKHYSVKDLVLKKIEEYPNVVIKFDGGFFENKRFLDVSQEIKNDSIHGNRFLGQLLEFAIAHFASVNNDE